MTHESTYRDDGWYRTFFQGIANDLWRQAVPEEMTRQQAAFLAARCGAPAGGSILDVPCGNGRLALELAAQGYHATGVDLSEESIDEAQRAAAARNFSVDFQCRDMRDLPWQAAFDAVYCWGNSFAYLDDAGDADFLRAVARALKPGGRFILETGSIAETLWPQFQADKTYDLGDIQFRAVRRYDFRHSRLYVDYHFQRGTQHEVRPASYRVYTVRELCELLTRCGFHVETLLGGIDGAPLTVGSPHLIAVATS